MTSLTTSSGLTGRRAIVTGGASGIGLACAEALADAGAHVTIADLDAESAASVASRIGGAAWTVDLGDTAALADLSLDADILVNNAGIQHVRPIEEFEPARFSLLLRVMAERTLTAFNKEHHFPHMLVFADRNQVEKEETFEIPSAARDRFMMEQDHVSRIECSSVRVREDRYAQAVSKILHGVSPARSIVRPSLIVPH